MKNFALLKTVEAFQLLDDRQLDTVQTYCEEVCFKKGDLLFAENEPSHHVWILAEGTVDLRCESKEEQRPVHEDIHFVSETKLFGWSCFVPPYQYYLSGYCDSEKCRLLRIKKEDLVLLFEKDMQLGHIVMSYVLRVVGTHFQQFRDELAKHESQSIESVHEIKESEQPNIPVVPKVKSKENKALEAIAINLLSLGKLSKEEIANVTNLDLSIINDLASI